MSTALAQLSACVTRILALTGFPKELKTRDIQAAFSEWETANGGFKIKWIDDTSLLVVFGDATVAKRAYLHTLAFPPAIFSSPTSPTTAIIKPYDGPDAQNVILNVNARQHNTNGRGHNVRGSVSHGRGVSVSHSFRNNASQSNGNINVNVNPDTVTSPRDREQPSPTLPNIPSHPTLNALISSSLSEVADPALTDPAVLAAQPDHSAAPRIGDPGKRIIGAALGVRHPGLPPRAVNGGGNGVADVQRAMGGIVISE